VNARALVENSDPLVGKPSTKGARPRHKMLADAIASADVLIAAQAKKLALLQQHKRGLEQQLEREQGPR